VCVYVIWAHNVGSKVHFFLCSFGKVNRRPLLCVQGVCVGANFGAPVIAVA